MAHSPSSGRCPRPLLHSNYTPFLLLLTVFTITFCIILSLGDEAEEV